MPSCVQICSVSLEAGQQRLLQSFDFYHRFGGALTSSYDHCQMEVRLLLDRDFLCLRQQVHVGLPD